ncbi:DUF4333 domain-containing protein [Streptomyces sp. A0958]|uniref:DUF4333 domain-containing protein n=1 Tax=Streptomyces sp. A0958 TaxID=2563101 RepID=UPI00109E888E|nr:DUF4333 domain-containing protein [Streptomyces sp. A0958]THA70836.1 DUF4333 domain-containing protein [Streptomyces sp. A0958]
MVAGAAAGTLALLFASGCSFSVGGDKVVKKAEVAKRASAGLGKVAGREPEGVTCKDDLKAKVGETVRCTLTDSGTKQGMTVTVKSVDGDNVKMDYKVDGGLDTGASPDPQPSDSAQPTDTSSGDTGGAHSVDKAEVARKGKAALAAQVGKEPDAFSCPVNLPARMGATIRCRLTDGSEQYGVTVIAKSVVGGKVDMGFKVDETPAG